MRACDRMARRSTCFHGKSTMTQRDSTRFAHIRTVLTLAHCLSCMIQHQCFDACHALGSASCLPHACTTLHDTTSHPFHTARSCLLCLAFSYILSHHFKGHAQTPLGACFCLRGFVLDFVCFCFSAFLLFWHTWRDLWVISVFVHFCCLFPLEAPGTNFSRGVLFLQVLD